MNQISTKVSEISMTRIERLRDCVNHSTSSITCMHDWNPDDISEAVGYLIADWLKTEDASYDTDRGLCRRREIICPDTPFTIDFTELADAMSHGEGFDWETTGLPFIFIDVNLVEFDITYRFCIDRKASLEKSLESGLLIGVYGDVEEVA